jgi:hypothetical protein
MSDAAEVAAIATRLRDALAADAGLTVAAPAFAGAATGSRAFAGAAPEQAGPGMTGVTVLLDDQPLPTRQPGAQPHSPAGRPGRTGRRRATTLAAGVTVLAGAGVAWLLASGALHDSPAADHLTVSPPATTAPGGSASLAPATGRAPRHPAAGASARPSGSATASASRQATHSPGTSPASSASPSQSSSASHSPGPTPTTTSPAPWPTLPLPLISLGL